MTDKERSEIILSISRIATDVARRMTEDERRQLIKGIRECAKMVAADPGLAKKLLIGTGMYTDDGKPKDRFK